MGGKWDRVRNDGGTVTRVVGKRGYGEGDRLASSSVCQDKL